MSTFQKLYTRAGLAVTTMMVGVPSLLAQTNTTPLGDTGPAPGPDNVPLRQLVTDILQYVLSFLALLAVIFIIIAGVRLIVSQGEGEQKDKAKKTIIYVIAGLIVILLAKVVVYFVTNTVNSGFTPDTIQ